MNIVDELETLIESESKTLLEIHDLERWMANPSNRDHPQRNNAASSLHNLCNALDQIRREKGALLLVSAINEEDSQ